jgi:hypothetical protein
VDKRRAVIKRPIADADNIVHGQRSQAGASAKSVISDDDGCSTRDIDGLEASGTRAGILPDAGSAVENGYRCQRRTAGEGVPANGGVPFRDDHRAQTSQAVKGIRRKYGDFAGDIDFLQLNAAVKRESSDTGNGSRNRDGDNIETGLESIGCNAS